MLVYNNLISRVLSVVPLGQCLSNLFLKLKQSLAICQIIAGSIMIWSISDMLFQQSYFPPYLCMHIVVAVLFHYCVCFYIILEACKDLRDFTRPLC